MAIPPTPTTPTVPSYSGNVFKVNTTVNGFLPAGYVDFLVNDVVVQTLPAPTAGSNVTVAGSVTLPKDRRSVIGVRTRNADGTSDTVTTYQVGVLSAPAFTLADMLVRTGPQQVMLRPITDIPNLPSPVVGPAGDDWLYWVTRWSIRTSPGGAWTIIRSWMDTPMTAHWTSVNDSRIADMYQLKLEIRYKVDADTWNFMESPSTVLESPVMTPPQDPSPTYAGTVWKRTSQAPYEELPFVIIRDEINHLQWGYAFTDYSSPQQAKLFVGGLNGQYETELDISPPYTTLALDGSQIPAIAVGATSFAYVMMMGQSRNATLKMMGDPRLGPTLQTRPEFTWVSPSAAHTTSVATFEVQPDTTSWTSYVVKLFTSGGGLLETKTFTVSPASNGPQSGAMDTVLENSTAYYLEAYGVTTMSGLTTKVLTRAFTTAFIEPALVSVASVVEDPTTRAVTLTLNPLNANIADYTWERSSDGGLTWTPPIEAGRDQTITDHTRPLVSPLTYRFVSRHTSGGRATSTYTWTRDDPSPYMTGLWSSGEDLDIIMPMRWGLGSPPEVTPKHSRGKSLVQMLGTTRPTEITSPYQETELSISFVVSSVAEKDQVIRQALLPGPHLIRMPDNASYYCSIGDVTPRRLSDGKYEITMSAVEVTP